MAKRAHGTGGVFKQKYTVDGEKRETKTWYMQWRDGGGKIHRMNTGKENKIEAGQELLKKLKGLGLTAPTADDVKHLKYETVRDSWLAAPRKKSPTGKVRSTYTRADGTISMSGLKHLDAYFSGWDVARISKETITDYASTQSKLSPTTLAKQLRLLHAILKHAVKHFGLGSVPDDSLVRPTVDNIRTGFTTPAQFQKVYTLLPEVASMVALFQFATGRRTGEVLKMTWSMVNADCTEVTIEGAITKSGQPSVLPLSGDNLEIVAKWMRRQFRKATSPIFPIGKESYRYHWNRVCGRLGLGVFDAKTRRYSGLRPHDLRRTAVKNMAKGGTDRAIAMEITGHRTESMYRRYSIVETGDMSDALKKTAAASKVKVTA